MGLGWQGWQATLDAGRPETGGGKYMFEHFADVLEAGRPTYEFVKDVVRRTGQPPV